jgi:hypothetical protein
MGWGRGDTVQAHVNWMYEYTRFVNIVGFSIAYKKADGINQAVAKARMRDM